MPPDYVSILAQTSANEIILVRQYRAAVDRITTELPSGHVDAGETPESAALRELEEETGYTADVCRRFVARYRQDGQSYVVLLCQGTKA